MKLSNNELALVYELRQEGCRWKYIALAMGCDWKSLICKVRNAELHGLYGGKGKAPNAN